MSNYKDTMAYGFYKQAEENLESGKAVEELFEKVLKEIVKATRYGNKVLWFDSDDYIAKVRYEAIGQLRSMGFKVTQSEHQKSELYVLWDYSEEDAQQESEL